MSPLLNDRGDGPVASWQECWWKGGFLPGWKVKDKISPSPNNSWEGVSPSADQFPWKHDFLLINVDVVGVFSCWSPSATAETAAAPTARPGVSSWERTLLLGKSLSKQLHTLYTLSCFTKM